MGGDPADRLTVTSTANGVDYLDGVITLREAIEFANAHPGADAIAFAIPESDPNFNATTGEFSIRPTTALPPITEQATIDGYTQPGASPNSNGPGQGDNATIKIALDGVAGPPTATGLEFAAGSGSVVTGLAIHRFLFGVVIRGPSTATSVRGNFLGTDAAGAVAMPNTASVALLLDASDNRIENNLISASGFGIIVGAQSTVSEASHVSGTIITGNYIGTDASGLSALGNGTGILINSSEDSQVGGPAAELANVIAHSTSGPGVLIGSNNASQAWGLT
jgi:hypothetical protein